MLRLIIDLDPLDPALGLALEEALLASVVSEAGGILRMWVNKPSVIVGRSQSVGCEVDLSKLRDISIPVIRRMSGGGAVYHYEGNMNLSLFLSDESRLGTVCETYAIIGDVIRSELSQLGIDARVEGNVIMVGNGKIAGAAQVRRGNILLYHTTLLVTPSPIPIERVLLAMCESYETALVPSHPRPVTSIARGYPSITMESLVLPLSRALSGLLGEKLQEGGYTRKEMEYAERLQVEKYGRDEWNLSR